MMYFFYKIGWPRLDAVKVAHSDALHPQDPPMCSVLTALKIFLWKRLEPENYPNDYNLGFFRLPGSPQKIETNLYLNIHMKQNNPWIKPSNIETFHGGVGASLRTFAVLHPDGHLSLPSRSQEEKESEPAAAGGWAFFEPATKKLMENDGKSPLCGHLFVKYEDLYGFSRAALDCQKLPEGNDSLMW